MMDTLNKFGLGHCDLPTMTWNVAVMLRVVVVKIQGGAESIPIFFYLLTTVCTVLYVFNYYASTLCFILACRETGDSLAAIMALSVSITSMIGVIKLIYMYRHQDKVRSLVADYIAYDRMPIWPGTTALMAEVMRNVKKRLILFWGVTMGNAVVFNLQPLVLLTKVNLYDRAVLYGLKYILGITYYPIAVFSIVISSFFICYIVSNVTGLLIITTGYSEAKLLFLSQEMRDLCSDAHKHYNDNFEGDSRDEKAAKEFNSYVHYRLLVIVKSHAININLIKKLEDIFRNGIAVEFLLLTAILITDLLAGLEDTYIILPFSLMQVGMDCCLGQKLMDANNVFVNAVYDCNWEDFDVENRKTVLLILKMSQKTLAVSAGGVVTLSFECLMVLYKTVYSAYTTLRSTME